jgi:ADP-heptose:LPS heptosyltransferase
MIKSSIVHRLLKPKLRYIVNQAIEVGVWLIHQTAPRNCQLLLPPRSLFILRNNDLGDLLVITPLFEALRDRFPNTKIVVGVGSWNVETLKNNPYISEVVTINAPWFNKVIPQQKLWDILYYLTVSPEIETLRQRSFDIGIDILGSPWGALLLLKAAIPYRLGVRGFAGGDTAMQACVDYNPNEYVGRSALRFAELLGAKTLPNCRPQLFLSEIEKQVGEQFWGETSGQKRLVIAPGSGREAKYWPLDCYKVLLAQLMRLEGIAIAIVGGSCDREAGATLTAINPKIKDLTAKTNLRETFALVNAADIVICNSSMIMHVAAAFAKPTIVVLGESFPSVRQHDAQWGYDRGYYSLGKEPGQRDTIATPDEVMTLLLKLQQC